MAPHHRHLSLRGTVLLCALSGALLSLCFPRLGLWFLAWVALVPWLMAVRLARPGAAFLGSWLGGSLFFAILVHWLWLFGISVWLLASLLLGLYLMLWGVLALWVGRLGPLPRMIGAAVLWCAIEWMRGLGAFGFTWGWLGYSQTPVLEFIQIARPLGALGLSFPIVLVNAALAEVLVGVTRREEAAAAAVRALAGLALAALFVFGARAWAKRLPRPSGPEIRVAVIQGSVGGPLEAEDVNVPLTAAEQRELLDVYGSLTAEASKRQPTLVVWPESVIPGPPESEAWIAARLSDIARSSDAWLLAGGPYQGEGDRAYNSAYLYSPTGNLRARYDKVQLVPFGEYVPGRSWLPFLSRYRVREFDFAAGPVHRVLQAGTITLGPMICFESTFPTISRRLAARRAQVLVIITNDAWFGHTAAAAQHRQIAVLRAVETGRWVVRAAATGISSIVAPDGRVISEAGLFRRAVLSGTIQAVTSPGPGRSGLVFAWLMVGLSVAYVIAPFALARHRGAPRAARPRPRRRPRGRAVPR